MIQIFSFITNNQSAVGHSLSSRTDSFSLPRVLSVGKQLPERLRVDIVAGLPFWLLHEYRTRQWIPLETSEFEEEKQSATQSKTDEVLSWRSGNVEFILREESDALALGHFYSSRETGISSLHRASERRTIRSFEWNDEVFSLFRPLLGMVL